VTEKTVQALARELDDRDESYALVTVVRAVAPTSAYVGAQAIVLADGTLHGWIGGGCTRDVVVGAAQRAIEAGQPKLVRISNEIAVFDDDVERYAMACASDGSVELFIDPRSARSMLAVLGETPAADEARFLASRLGLRLTSDAATAPVVLIATQGRGDEDALEAALRGNARHVLMIASARKADRLRAAMRLRGLDAAALARLSAPAGPAAGAKTPGEIALVAMAGVLACLRAPVHAERESRSGVAQTAAAARDAAEGPERAAPAATFVNPVCGVAVSVAAPRHVEVYADELYYFCCDRCLATFRENPAKYAAIHAATQPATADQRA